MALPPLTPNEFYQQIRKDLVSRARYTVEIGSIIGLPRIVAGQPVYSINNSTEFLCDEAEIPGVNVLTKEARTFGPEYKLPYVRSYDPVQLSFFVLKDFNSRSFFQEWMHIISNYNDNNTGYYANYVTDIKVHTWSIDAKGFHGSGLTSGLTFGLLGQNRSGLKSYLLHTAVLQNAYPVRVDTLPLAWNDSDSYHRQTVNFHYESIYFPSVKDNPTTGNWSHADKQLEGALG